MIKMIYIHLKIMMVLYVEQLKTYKLTLLKKFIA